MPELPEVQTVVSDLRPILVGQTFTGIDSTVENAVSGALDGAARIVDAKILDVLRRGKFILIQFENDYIMTIHLRMSGRLLWRASDDEELKFERTRIEFSGGSLRFCDMRKFGKVWVSKTADLEEETGICNLGPEIVKVEKDGSVSTVMNAEEFVALFRNEANEPTRKGAVKKWLLDQGLLAGIGNIYADEACFYAGIRPGAAVEDLGREALKELHAAVVKSLKQGIRNRGTSVSDYADAYGKTGRNQELLYVYGRGGEECLNCHTTLKKIRLAGRGTVYCESCQK